jgi:hypothetical protein
MASGFSVIGRLLVILLAMLLAACGGDDRPSPTAVPSATPSGTSVASQATIPSPAVPPLPPQFTPPPRPPDTVWLFDVATGNRTTLLESARVNVLKPRFGPDDTVLVSTLVVNPMTGNQVETLRLRFDGTVVSRGPAPQPDDSDCVPSSDGAVVLGRQHRDIACGQISPDRRWMTYQIDAGMAQVVPPAATNPGRSVPVWDQWVVELPTDQRRLLQPGLLHCGGCDARFSPTWSPSGRLLYFSELRSEGSTFISDMQTGITRELFSGSTEISVEPDWSPVADVLVYRTAMNVTVLHDFTTGTRTELADLSWPVRFDTSGDYLYSPAWDNDFRTAGGDTTVYDIRTGRVIATLAGLPRYDALLTKLTAVRGMGGTFIAVLEGAADCDGVAVYRGSARLACVNGGRGGLLSPDGRLVAIARLTHEVSPPRPWQFSEFEIVLIDPFSDGARTLAGGALGQEVAPELIWNDTSTHLLVRWPFGGYGP